MDNSSETPRHVGADSRTGGIRESNQDRVQVFALDGLDGLVLADGLGGLPHGAEAAEVATTYSVDRLRAELPEALEASAEGVRTALLSTAWATATKLAREAKARGWADEPPCFRTTLILVAALVDCYVVVWIGDGAVNVLRSDGEILTVLEPHKHVDTPDVLDASLGPTTDGRPSWALVARRPGDLLVAATDGVGDLLNDSTHAWIRETLHACARDADKTAKLTTATLADLRDEDGGLVITDNLTLALVHTEEETP